MAAFRGHSQRDKLAVGIDFGIDKNEYSKP
jgi:hypothetical protein